MPSITRKLCPTHGIYSTKTCPLCSEIQHEKRKVFQSKYDKTKRNKDRKKFYNSTEWQKLRVGVLKYEPICRVCKHKEAQAVDHICPIAQGGGQLDKENLQPICNSCHGRKTAREKEIFYPEWLQPPRIPVTIVCGSIGSGKSHYAKTKATNKDLIIDLDDIKVKLTGKKMYQWEGKEQLNESIKARNLMLFGLSKKSILKYDRAYFIISAPKSKDREWWSKQLNAEVILIDVMHQTCVRRVGEDTRRKDNLALHIRLIDDWFSKFSPSPIDRAIKW